MGNIATTDYTQHHLEIKIADEYERLNNEKDAESYVFDTLNGQLAMLIMARDDSATFELVRDAMNGANPDGLGDFGQGMLAGIAWIEKIIVSEQTPFLTTDIDRRIVSNLIMTTRERVHESKDHDELHNYFTGYLYGMKVCETSVAVVERFARCFNANEAKVLGYEANVICGVNDAIDFVTTLKLSH